MITSPLRTISGLRDYQHEAVAAFESARARGVRRQLFVLATGAGKTVIFSHIVRDMGVPALILAHRNELIDQAVAKAVASGISPFHIGVVQAERNERGRPVTVASVQTLSGAKRLAQFPGDAFGLIVVDEAHHAFARSYRRVLDHFGALSSAGPLLLGFTATPDRGDGKRIGTTIFEEQVFTRGTVDLIGAGYLCDAQCRGVRIAANLDTVRVAGGDFVPGALGEALSVANVPTLIARAYRDYAPTRKGLVFTPTVALAYAVRDALRELGIACAAIDCETPKDERAQVLDDLRTGAVQVVANCAVLTEGFDEPSVDCVVVCRPTKSRPLLAQMVGRGLRLHPGKADCLILYLAPGLTDHDIASIPDVFGMADEDMPDSVTVTAAAKTGEERAEAEALEEAAEQARFRDRQRAERTRLEEHKILIFPTKHEQGVAHPDDRYRALHWVSVSPRICGALPLKDGHVVSVRCNDGWRVIACVKGLPDAVLLTTGNAGEATRCAERFVRDAGYAGLAAEDAPWRSRPASDGQLSYARKLGYGGDDGIPSGGIVSDFILIAKAARHLRHAVAQRYEEFVF